MAVRHEVQRRDRVRITFASVDPDTGTGRTGLSPVASLRRLSDGLYWDGSAWDTPYVGTLALVEVSVADEPGRYVYEVPGAGLDPVLGAQGYESQVIETAFLDADFIDIRVQNAPSEHPFEGIPRASTPTQSLVAQLGRDLMILLSVETDPPILGRAGSFVTDSFFITVDGDRTELDGSDLVMIESASRPSGGAEAVVQDPPVFTAGGGPDGEDIIVLTLDDAMPFEVGDYIRAAAKPAGAGAVHKVLARPDSETLHVHSWSTGYDIVDGDTIDEVIPIGVYTGSLVVPAADLPTPDVPTGEVSITLVSLAEGDGPVFEAVTTMGVSCRVSLDLGTRRVAAG